MLDGVRASNTFARLFDIHRTPRLSLGTSLSIEKEKANAALALLVGCGALGLSANCSLYEFEFTLAVSHPHSLSRQDASSCPTIVDLSGRSFELLARTMRSFLANQEGIARCRGARCLHSPLAREEFRRSYANAPATRTQRALCTLYSTFGRSIDD